MGDIRAKGGTINDREKLTAEEAETATEEPVGDLAALADELAFGREKNDLIHHSR